MKALWIILAVIVVLCLILYIACVCMVKISIAAGTNPKQINRKPHTGKENPVQRQLRETKEQGRAWREAQAFEQVSIQSRDGLKLAGYYLPCPEAVRTVLLVHGWRSDWSDMWEYGPFLQEQRCNMLFVEQRGHGASEGKYMGFGVLERYDCMKWIDYLREREPELPIYLLGCSQGAATVLMTSGFGLPEQVRGIVADCGFTSPEEQVTQKLREWWHMPRQPFMFLGNIICRHRAKFSYSEYSTLEALKTNHTPVLFVHGSEDRFVPVRDTMRNYEACVAEKDLLIVEGARHIQSYALGGDAYREKLSKFFQRYDPRRTSDREGRDESYPQDQLVAM